jgi:hypothetical protein
MYSLNVVAVACGPKLARYVKNKNKGGTAGQKGTRYEDRFALLKICEAAKQAFAAGNGTFSPSWNVSFLSQAFCFVDDLVIIESPLRPQIITKQRTRETPIGGKGRNL